MHPIFKSISIPEIIQPGELYLLSNDSERGGYPEPIYWLFLISKEEELFQALEIEFCILIGKEYEALKFLGVKQLDKDCHEFSILCTDLDDGKKVSLKLYLHRLQSFTKYIATSRRLLERRQNLYYME